MATAEGYYSDSEDQDQSDCDQSASSTPADAQNIVPLEGRSSFEP